jgi:hypothetical protein
MYYKPRSMSRTSEHVVHELIQLEAERREVFRRVARVAPFTVGSLNVVRRTCGKTGCHCARDNDPGHPTTVLMTGPAGKRRCQVVRKADVAKVKTGVELYRLYREGLRLLKHLEAQQKALMRELMSLRSQPYE